jgi:hypothetical protein
VDDRGSYFVILARFLWYEIRRWVVVNDYTGLRELATSQGHYFCLPAIVVDLKHSSFSLRTAKAAHQGSHQRNLFLGHCASDCRPKDAPILHWRQRFPHRSSRNRGALSCELYIDVEPISAVALCTWVTSLVVKLPQDLRRHPASFVKSKIYQFLTHIITRAV